MVIDEDAFPLQRSWCLFELLQTFLLTSSDASRNFQGLSFCTAEGVLSSGGAGVDVAMGIAQRLTSLRLEDASATCEQDKTMIDERVRTMDGGFPAMNMFVRAKIRDALLQARDSFEGDFQNIVASLDQCVMEGLRAEASLTARRTVCVCGNVFMDDAFFCRKCGTKRPETSPQAEPEDELQALKEEVSALERRLTKHGTKAFKSTSQGVIDEETRSTQSDCCERELSLNYTGTSEKEASPQDSDMCASEQHLRFVI
jgi:hypothetical protein